MFDDKAYKKEWYKKNRENILKAKKEYYQNNKETLIIKNKNYKKLNPDKFKFYGHVYSKKHPEKSMLTRIRTRAKKYNIPFDLTIDDIKIPDRCPILNIPIIRECILGGKKGPKASSPSLDRFDNTKGYIKGNVHVISNKANVMKSSASPEDLLQFAYWIILTYGHLIDKEIN